MGRKITLFFCLVKNKKNNFQLPPGILTNILSFSP
jgi:hypothetical protein